MPLQSSNHGAAYANSLNTRNNDSYYNRSQINSNYTPSRSFNSGSMGGGGGARISGGGMRTRP
jgi:hypothetical protein